MIQRAGRKTIVTIDPIIIEHSDDYEHIDKVAANLGKRVAEEILERFCIKKKVKIEIF